MENIPQIILPIITQKCWEEVFFYNKFMKIYLEEAGILLIH
ncbi:hypothetical protein [Chryseobacterium limigenitum]|nr:hypothetical protein [Chryseobacterium limigenitum]